MLISSGALWVPGSKTRDLELGFRPVRDGPVRIPQPVFTVCLSACLPADMYVYDSLEKIDTD